MKILKKHNQIREPSITYRQSNIQHVDIPKYLHYLQLHSVYQQIKMCVFIRHTFCGSFVKLCLTKHKCLSLLRYFFRHIGQCFLTAQTKTLENQKSSHVRIIIHGYVSLVYNFVNLLKSSFIRTSPTFYVLCLCLCLYI